jgi:hypothetical protein
MAAARPGFGGANGPAGTSCETVLDAPREGSSQYVN